MYKIQERFWGFNGCLQKTVIDFFRTIITWLVINLYNFNFSIKFFQHFEMPLCIVQKLTTSFKGPVRSTVFMIVLAYLI